MTTTATRRTVAPGHAAIEVLKVNGVEVVFGLNGDHVLRLYDGLADLGGITPVTVKHENNAALAAEAYGRLTGRPGVALVTAGPAPSTRYRASPARWPRARRSSRCPAPSQATRALRDLPRRRRGRLHRARLRDRHQVLASRHPCRGHPGRARRRLRAGGRRPTLARPTSR